VWRRAALIRKAGLDPIADVEFKQFPAPLLRAAVDKGEAHAVADGDPNT
jgi:NitT/TauT family transport system substrate-binding protein